MNWLGIAMRNVLRNGRSVASTALILVVGTVALLIGSGFMLYTYDSLQDIAIRTQGHVILTDTHDTAGDQITHHQLSVRSWKTLADELLAIPGVVRVLPRAYFEGLISNGNRAAAFFGTGVNPKEEFRVHGPFLRTTRGDVLDPSLMAEATPEIILGEDLAQALDARVGDVLTLRSQGVASQLVEMEVRLVGTYRTGTEEKDAHSLMMALDTTGALLARDRVDQLSVYLEQRHDTERIRQFLLSKYADLEVETWQQRANLYDKVKALYDRLFGLMGAIIVAIVFLAISNTIGLAIYQRRVEIATLGALGTPPAQIYRMIMLEACLLGVVATTLGMSLAYATASAINALEVTMPAPPGKNEGYPLFIDASVDLYLSTSAVLVVVSVLASLVAAFQRARANIAEAMQ